MDWCLVHFLLSFLILVVAWFVLHHRSSSQGRLPPGPRGWPILGNLLDLEEMPHKTLCEMRDKYGEVIWLRLGVKNTMVILSSKAASEFFKNHDLSFADRSITEVSRVHDFDKSSVALAPYGSYWRVLKRLVTVDMLVTKRINDTAFVRRECVDDMLLCIEEEASKLGDGQGVEFFTAMMRLMEWNGHANLGDFFPWLRWLDLQGLRRSMEKDLGQAIDIASGFVKEKMNNIIQDHNLGSDEKRKDFLSVLLGFQGNGKDEPDKISDRDINIFILELFLAGGETTSSTIEWAMTELLLSPKSMMKAKAELTQLVGPKRKVEESDIDNLPYLQAVIKETMRLHPPIPFLVPRKATKDTNFMGFFIPKNTQFVNAWAIGRDPDVWDEPLCFKPERFIDSKIDYKHYELIPFGAGRRMCAGVTGASYASPSFGLAASPI
ncbi:hypothetical protein FNV43_RR15650 [Rhamnella rubrinervis]|uniref:Cytochrome P450 n=1 Tax=Rhamnella rubrinervis TaxID=2594499 RepID=A0A8K0E9G5_9ROSA|nr:hypothetical protein FNV43_RR15650 [Rhamnella rubrinervis]